MAGWHGHALLRDHVPGLAHGHPTSGDHATPRLTTDGALVLSRQGLEFLAGKDWAVLADELAADVAPAALADAAWTGNFRDLNGAVVRMATLAPGGRITVEIVEDEMRRLAAAWRAAETPRDDLVEQALGRERASQLDLFDRVQLAEVLQVCRRARSLSDAGRSLFAISRLQKSQPNDADRLRKYLARFGIAWQQAASTNS
jgi:sigma54-dependent transcription regulator